VTADPDGRLHIRRDGSFRDDAGNAFGILDVSPDVTDPAILLGIRLVATGELRSLALRAGDVIDEPGLHLRVAALSTNDVASITLVAATA
jgi:hypothetical protein